MECIVILFTNQIGWICRANEEAFCVSVCMYVLMHSVLGKSTSFTFGFQAIYDVLGRCVIIC